MKPAPFLRPTRGPALLWVLGAHLGLAWLLVLALRPSSPVTPAPTARPPLWLRWVAEPRPPAAAPRSPAAIPARLPRPLPPPALAIPQWPQTQLQAITLPPPAAEPPASAPRTAQTPAPLDLRLPPAASQPARSWASRLREDPRLRDAPLTTEQRIARALDPTITEEVLPDGSRRLRRGNDCVIARPSRAGQIDPFDSTRPRPWLVGEC